MILAAFSWVGPQLLTFAIPLGTLGLVILFGFFQRKPPSGSVPRMHGRS